MLIFIIGTYVTYNFYNPPRSAISLSVPVQTLKRLGFNNGDLPFKLSGNISCNNTVGSQNFVMMFGNRMEREIWNQNVILYLAWKDILQITEEVYLCLPFKGKLEPVWTGRFNLLGTFNLYIMHKSFFVTKRIVTRNGNVVAMKHIKLKVKKHLNY